MIVALKLPSEKVRQPSETPPRHASRKVRPLAVRSGDMLALRITRIARMPAAEAIGDTESGAPNDASLRR
jgi:hypothetical protein